MAIFKYSFKKMVFSPSSWVLLTVSTLLLGCIWYFFNSTITGHLIPGFSSSDFLNIALARWTMTSAILFVDVLLFIFIAIKATQVFRDELDDGTLLILVSKPVTKNSLYLQKILAFQTMMALFLIISPLVASLPLLLLGNNGVVFIALLPKILILIVFAFFLQLIASSLIILLSLSTSSKIIVCITIVFGFAIALSSMVSKFIQPNQSDLEYTNISHDVETYQYFHNNLATTDFNLINNLVTSSEKQAQAEITTWSNSIVNFYLKVLHSDPTITDPNKIAVNLEIEQQQLKLLAQDPERFTAYGLTTAQIKLDAKLYRILETTRILPTDNYLSMIGTRVTEDSNMFFSMAKFATGINNIVNDGISEATYHKLQASLTKQRLMKYLNISSQWEDMLQVMMGNEQTKVFGSYGSNATGNLVLNFTKNSNGNYMINLKDIKSMNVILNSIGLFSVYIILGIVAFMSTWYFFNRRDFT